MSERRRTLVCALVLAQAAGCALGPNYKRPSVPMSASYRFQSAAEQASFADLPWWEVFHDPALTALLREALANNFDLADAVERIAVARENARIRTDQLLPAFTVGGGPSYNQIFSPFSAAGGGTTTNAPRTFRFADYQLQGALTWEIDLWGRLRRLRQSALADFLASEENARGVIVSLIGEVAQDYFTLLALDLQLAVARQTAESRRATLALFQTREEGGVGDRLQTASEEANLADALATIPGIERQIAALENQLCFLAGRVPGPIARGRPEELTVRPVPPDQPAGLPAQLLERRPDVRQAEARLVSANALVGAAFAQLFPQLTLSGNVGVESTSLSTLFTSNAFTFGIGVLVNWLAPILNGAQYAHQYRAQQATYRALLADYRRAVLGALVDVANALIAIAKLREIRAQLETEVRARSETVKLAKDRYRAGVSSYLDVVQAEQNLFPSELQLAQTIGAQFAAIAQLYRALGGGWQMPAPPSAARQTSSSPRQ